MINAQSSEPSEITVDDLLSTTIVMGRFLRECGTLPAFTSDFTFLHCLILFVIGKEPQGITRKILYRQVGISWGHGKEIVGALEDNGDVRLKNNALHITDAGRAKLDKASQQLLPFVETAVDQPARLQNIAKLWNYLGRALNKAIRPAREDNSTASGS